MTDANLSNDAFPYLTSRRIAVGPVACLALRVTYVGELGWELYCRTDDGLALWDRLWTAGTPLGMVAGGYRAIDTMRLEKGYRVWSTDITPEDNPYEAGLGFAVRLNKGVDFIGKEALISAKANGITRRLRPLLLGDPEAIALGGEPVRVSPSASAAFPTAARGGGQGGDVIGRVTSGGYGYSTQRSIAYAYLPPTCTPGSAVDVQVFGRWVPATVASEPLYDPAGDRIRS